MISPSRDATGNNEAVSSYPWHIKQFRTFCHFPKKHFSYTLASLASSKKPANLTQLLHHRQRKASPGFRDTDVNDVGIETNQEGR